MSEPPVLIVGAGPTGLVLALWLARAGVPFRLIDRRRRPRRGVAGDGRPGPHPRVLPPARRRRRRRRRRVPDGPASTSATGPARSPTVPLGDVGKGISPYPFALSFPQDDHERLLTDRLRAAGARGRVGHRTCRPHAGRAAASGPTSARPAASRRGPGSTCAAATGPTVRSGTASGVGFPGGTYDQLVLRRRRGGGGRWSDRDINGYIAEKTFCLAFPVRQPGMFRFIGLVPEDLRRPRRHHVRGRPRRASSR